MCRGDQAVRPDAAEHAEGTAGGASNSPRVAAKLAVRRLLRRTGGASPRQIAASPQRKPKWGGSPHAKADHDVLRRY